MSRKLLVALQELLDAESAVATKDVVARHPELLEDDAIRVLAGLTEEVEERLKPPLANLLAVLMESREVGLDAAFENFEPASPGRDLTDDLAALIVAQDAAELKAAVVECPELLGDAAERRLLEMEADSSAYAADRLYAIVTFLRACRGGEIDAACAAYDRDISDVEAASQLAARYAFMADEREETEFLREHPVLLGRQAEEAIASLCSAPSTPDPEVAAFLSRCRAKLEGLSRLREAARAGR